MNLGCNAWNHSFDCNCGFGGWASYGCGGSSQAPPRYWTHQLPSAWQSFGWAQDRKFGFDNYTVPNAHCPVCGEEVFFYQSPYGGRVFFDELGPPWPKHPCTDNGYRVLRTLTRKIRQPSWVSAGWSPLLFAKTYQEKERVLVTGDFCDRFITLTLIGSSSVNCTSPILVRPHAEAPGFYQVAVLASDPLSLTAVTRTGVGDVLSSAPNRSLGLAAEGDPAALLEIAHYLLYEAGIPAMARRYLERALSQGMIEAAIDLAVIEIFLTH